ncbi:hypothetical protein SESBI_24848 [Sesbania bispinosa]|nr:hypothetical protein SESBI_24848 [Sesbania bispinosa]
MGVIDTESYPPLPRELDPLPPSGGPMWRRQAPAQPLEDDLNPIVLAKATAIRQGRHRREEWKWKWIIVLSGLPFIPLIPFLLPFLSLEQEANYRDDMKVLSYESEDVQQPRRKGVAPSVRIRCRGDGWGTTPQKESPPILFHIMAAIPGMGIHYQMSRHKKRDMPERQDTANCPDKEGQRRLSIKSRKQVRQQEEEEARPLTVALELPLHPPLKKESHPSAVPTIRHFLEESISEGGKIQD